MHTAFISPIPLHSPLLLTPSLCPSCPVHSLRALPHPRPRTKTPVLSSKDPPSDSPDSSDSTPSEHDIPKSIIDWNSEWAKFSETGMRSMAPKGREPISKQQAAAARARNKVLSVTNRMPTRHQLFKDWRFWVAIIATLSLFSAFIQSTSQSGVNMV